MFPILPEGGSANLSQPQQQQMRSGEYTSYMLPSGSVFTTLPPPPPQQQQQRAFMSPNSVLIDPPTTFLVQAQQQQQHKAHAILTYPHSPQGNPLPPGMSPFPSAHPNSIPVYATTGSIDSSPFAAAISIPSSNPAARTQRVDSAINSIPCQPHQQQPQRLQPVFLHAAITNSTLMTPSYQQQQQQLQRGNSISINSAHYYPLAGHSQASVLSPTPPGSTHSQLFAMQPLTSSSGGMQACHVSAAAGHVNATTSAYSATPPSSAPQHPQQIVAGTTASVPEVPNNLSAATASTHSSSTATTTAAAAATTAANVSNGVVDAEEMRQANERPFRFKMLPPPPTFDRFLLQWEANAADAHYRPWRRGDGGCSPHGDSADRTCVLTEEDVLQRSAAAARATVVTSPGSGATMRTAEERLALAEQYRRILERWWYYMSVFEQKAEVRQRLGSLYTCPDYADAKRAVSSGFAELLPGELQGQLTEDEVTLQTWSHLVLKWWEETKRRRRTRRSRRGSRKDASSSSRTGRSTLDDSQMDGDATPPQIGNDEETSVASGNSFGVPSTEGSPLTHSLPDNEGYLNFDFTNQTRFGSPAESG